MTPSTASEESRPFMSLVLRNICIDVHFPPSPQPTVRSDTSLFPVWLAPSVVCVQVWDFPRFSMHLLLSGILSPEICPEQDTGPRNQGSCHPSLPLFPSPIPTFSSHLLQVSLSLFFFFNEGIFFCLGTRI